ncbi:hypothetical protein AVEN_170816-1 [Araneus ventricosus]|uniref:HTH CENPB-type domain-containing protein n=1 Tax=Araneus ventricosus TaxID=182803 RepID=A0A4Y2RD95_ARAVE|nr:hypothetical protein AVEN_170816-1 [Araneus ventricosus]
MGLKEFVATYGWFHRWRKRENVVFKQNYGAQKSAVANQWIEKEWLKLIASYPLKVHPLTYSGNRISADKIRNCFAHRGFCEALDEKLQTVILSPEGMQKEEYEEWMSIDEAISVAATLSDLEICQAVCEQDQTMNVDDSDGDECVEVNPP